MYHQISRNKRNSVLVIIGFLVVWLLVGLIVGWLASGNVGAIGGAIVLGLLGVGAALYAYYFGSATVLSAMGAHEADPRQYQQLHNIVQALAALISSVFWHSVGRMRLRGQGAIVVLAVGLLFTLVAFVVGPLMQFALSRQRESLADVSGVELTRNPTGLIHALQKIAQNDKPPERFNHAVAAMMIDNPDEHHGSFFSRLFDTHPPIAERIAELQRIASVQQV